MQNVIPTARRANLPGWNIDRIVVLSIGGPDKVSIFVEAPKTFPSAYESVSLDIECEQGFGLGWLHNAGFTGWAVEYMRRREDGWIEVKTVVVE